MACAKCNKSDLRWRVFAIEVTRKRNRREHASDRTSETPSRQKHTEVLELADEGRLVIKSYLDLSGYSVSNDSLEVSIR